MKRIYFMYRTSESLEAFVKHIDVFHRLASMGAVTINLVLAGNNEVAGQMAAREFNERKQDDDHDVLVVGEGIELRESFRHVKFTNEQSVWDLIEQIKGY